MNADRTMSIKDRAEGKKKKESRGNKATAGEFHHEAQCSSKGGNITITGWGEISNRIGYEKSARNPKNEGRKGHERERNMACRRRKIKDRVVAMDNDKHGSREDGQGTAPQRRRSRR